MDSSWSDDANEQQSITYFDANGDVRDPDQPTDNFSRPLKERWSLVGIEIDQASSNLLF